MKVIRDAKELPRASDIAFVPTMGALHAGHQSLIRRARQLTENVLVSAYINPLQFENKSDLANYPKTPLNDEELAGEAGAKYLWFPKFYLWKYSAPEQKLPVIHQLPSQQKPGTNGGPDGWKRCWISVASSSSLSILSRCIRSSSRVAF